MKIGENLIAAKIWLNKLITGRQSRPKIARKKLQIQFHKIQQQFEHQISLLESRLSQPGLSPSSEMLGQYLLQDAQRFLELNLIDINTSRLETTTQPLVHPVDFSMWVLYQTYSMSEEIYHFLKTCEVMDL